MQNQGTQMKVLACCDKYNEYGQLLHLGVVLGQLAQCGGQPGVVGPGPYQPQAKDGVVRHLGVSVVGELAAITRVTCFQQSTYVFDTNYSVPGNKRNLTVFENSTGNCR